MKNIPLLMARFGFHATPQTQLEKSKYLLSVKNAYRKEKRYKLSKENIYTGAAAELFVAKRLLENFWPVFYKMVDCDADLIALQPTCNHAVSIQVKLAYKDQSFHAKEYKNIDYYAVVYATAEWRDNTICWIPCYEVAANFHASLTQEWKEWYTNDIPESLCSKCQKQE